MIQKSIFGILSMMVCFLQQSYAADSGTYAMQMSVSSEYVLNESALPSNIVFPTEINSVTKNEPETIGPYNISAYTNVPDVGFKLTLVNADNKQHPPGSDQLYLVRTPTLSNRSDQSLRIPYKVLFKPCYNSEYPPGTTPPETMTLHPDPEGDENKVLSVYAQDIACAPGRDGEQAQLSFEREAMNYLPVAGTYEGTVAIEIGPE